MACEDGLGVLALCIQQLAQLPRCHLPVGSTPHQALQRVRHRLLLSSRLRPPSTAACRTGQGLALSHLVAPCSLCGLLRPSSRCPAPCRICRRAFRWRRLLPGLTACGVPHPVGAVDLSSACPPAPAQVPCVTETLFQFAHGGKRPGKDSWKSNAEKKREPPQFFPRELMNERCGSCGAQT